MTGREYAARTTVPIFKTHPEIMELLQKHGADGFGFDYEGDHSTVRFRMSGLYVQITLTMPPLDDFALTPKRIRRTSDGQHRAWEQACRQRWRALLLIIRAKLEAVESGVTSLESEFLANVMLPNNLTVGQVLAPQIEEAYATGRVRGMLAEGSQ